MKKIFSLLLVVVMCFSLAACGNSSKLEKYKKYEALINYMEAGDYESALAEMIRISENGGSVDNAGDESGEKTAKAVGISIDNWQEYFEIVEREETEKNEFEEIEDMYKGVYLVLKDEYEMVGYDTSIAIEYNYINEWRYVEIDKENGVLTIGELVPDRENEEMNGLTMKISGSKTSLTNGRSWSEGMQAVPTNFEIVRIQGTLYIAE